MKFAFLDVDGTLIDKDDNVRPHLSELIDGLLELGATLIIWSAGGNKYAESKWNMICNKIYRETGKVYHYKVTDFMWKKDWQETALIGDRLYIDDQAELVLEASDKKYAGFLVSFYESATMDTDVELLEALEFAENCFVD